MHFLKQVSVSSWTAVIQNQRGNSTTWAIELTGGSLTSLDIGFLIFVLNELLELAAVARGQLGKLFCADVDHVSVVHVGSRCRTLQTENIWMNAELCWRNGWIGVSLYVADAHSQIGRSSSHPKILASVRLAHQEPWRFLRRNDGLVTNNTASATLQIRLERPPLRHTAWCTGRFESNFTVARISELSNVRRGLQRRLLKSLQTFRESVPAFAHLKSQT